MILIFFLIISMLNFVTVNLHIGLESGYLDQKGLAPWQPGPYLALCFLDSKNQAYYPPTSRFIVTMVASSSIRLTAFIAVL